MRRLLHHLTNIRLLGVKELWSLWRDPMMLVLIVYTFTVAIYTAGTAMPETLHHTPMAIVDEDDSALSARIFSAFYPPAFNAPVRITNAQVDPALDAGHYTLVLVITPNLQRDALAHCAAQCGRYAHEPGVCRQRPGPADRGGRGG